jgi:N-acyl homoserine lactone hydrolase
MQIEPTTSAHEETLKDQPAIRSLRVLSSGWGEQHREHRYGSLKPRLLWALTSRSWVKVPINYFLIEHRDGPLLFDTGLDPAIVSDPQYINSAIGRFLMKRIFRLHLSEDDGLDKIMAKAGVSPHAIRYAVISHLHFDHVGGIRHIPQAELLVSELEWAQLSEPHPEREWILKEHIERPEAKWTPFVFSPSNDPLFEGFAGTYDVAGDGSMILIPTPGHTPGSISMLIRRNGWAPILLVADLAYEASLIERNVVPGTGDKQALLSSYTKVRLLKEKLPDLVVITSHDFSAADAISGAIGKEIA